MDEKTKPIQGKENHHDSNNGGWVQVTYGKKKQNKKMPQANVVSKNGNLICDQTNDMFESLEKSSEQRRRNIEDRRASNFFDYDDEKGFMKSLNFRSENEVEKIDGKGNKNGATEKKEKKKKKKKEKKEMKTTNMTVAEAAMNIDAADLANFLADNSAASESQQEVQLMRFADYFGQAFSHVSAAQFLWLTMFKDSTLDKIADIPICHIPDCVHKTSTEWIGQRSNESLESFVLWALDSILGDITVQKYNLKGQKKGGQSLQVKSQVAMFLVISMTLRQRPEVMINLLPTLRMNTKYHGQNKLPIYAWMIIQASQGDLPIGLYLWAHFILPLLEGKPSSNPNMRELVLQLVERIFSRPNAQKILANGAVRKGERLIPPSAVDLLLHITFPMSSIGNKTTDRFEAMYPKLVYVALAGTPRSKSIKQLSLQVQDFALKSTTGGNAKLSEEANKLLLWCLTQNTECCKQWESIYAKNLETSIAILKKLIQRWTELSSKLDSQEALRDTIKTFRKKNEQESRAKMDAARQALLKEADKYCNLLLRKMFWDKYGYMIFKLSIVIPMVSAFAYIYGYKEYSRTVEFLWNYGKLHWDRSF